MSEDRFSYWLLRGKLRRGELLCGGLLCSGLLCSSFIIFSALIFSTAAFAGSGVTSPTQRGIDSPQQRQQRESRESLPFNRDLDIDIPKLPGITDEDFLKTPAPLIKPLPPGPKVKKGPLGDGFTLKAVKIEGATLYRPSVFKDIYEYYLGKFVSFGDLNKIAQRIETFYTNEGWLAAKVVIPRQAIADGTIRLRVFEGRIADIVVEGKTGKSKDIIESYLAGLKTGRPGRFSDLEEGLARLQDFPNLTLQSRLRVTETDQAGGIDLVVNVLDRDIFSGALSLNNIANESVGPWILSFGGNTESIFSGGDKLSLSASTSIAKPEETLVGRTSYEQRFSRLQFLGNDIYGIIAGIYVGGNLTQPDRHKVSTPTKDFGVSSGLYTRLPLYRSRMLNMEASLEYDFERRKTSRKNDGVVLTDGEMNIISLGLDMNFRSTWSSYSILAAKIRQGLTEGGGPDSENPSGCCYFRRRATWVTLDISHNQSLLWPQRFLTSILPIPVPNLSSFISLQGQYAIDQLPNSHRISFGNSNIGRGFNAGRISGHHGFGISTEMRAAWGRIGQLDFLGFAGRSFFDDITFYGFFDFARIPRDKSFVGQSRRTKLFSTGAGLRTRLFSLLYAEFTWARALNNPYEDHPGTCPFFQNSDGTCATTQAPPQGDLSDKGGDEFLFRLAYLF